MHAADQTLAIRGLHIWMWWTGEMAAQHLVVKCNKHMAEVKRQIFRKENKATEKQNQMPLLGIRVLAKLEREAAAAEVLSPLIVDLQSCVNKHPIMEDIKDGYDSYSIWSALCLLAERCVIKERRN
ncbi:Protein of unknown function [Pyronema omphalodes CBS 100304]|uniref:Uncharacterized protein n=1 Tax=Pyronema omphalodes (strain CBS 100304) TaxID=1076935 RepID=U4L0N1_PYROM|nr:Protein of unknown function [Pyronema omphalodes CBS 100304]